MKRNTEDATSYLSKEVGEIPPHSAVLKKYDPEVSEALQTIREKVLRDGALPKKT